MWHAPYSQVNWVDSQLFVVGSQTDSLTSGLLLAITYVLDVQMSNVSPF